MFISYYEQKYFSDLLLLTFLVFNDNKTIMQKRKEIETQRTLRSFFALRFFAKPLRLCEKTIELAT